MHRGVVGDVGYHGGAADLLGESTDGLAAAGHRDHVKTLCGQGPCCRLADAGTGTGHHRDA